MRTTSIIKAIKKHKTFLISTHINPDPDALSSELALAMYLKSIGKKVSIINEDKIPLRYTFMPGSKKVKHYQKTIVQSFDVAIIVDCGELGRIGRVEQLIERKTILINIDHHISNRKFGHHNLVCPKASSTAEVLFDLLKDAKCKMTKDIAQNLYLGIMTDTGSFRYECTSAHTHQITSELMKYDFSISELYQTLYEMIPHKDIQEFVKLIGHFKLVYNKRVAYIDLKMNVFKKFSGSFDLRDQIFKFLRMAKGVEVAIIFSEQKRRITKVNLRSQGAFNVARLAGMFSGGGHKRASGCVLQGDLRQTKRRVLQQIQRML